MFRQAVTIANQFTFPVIVTRRNVKGDCSSNFGTFIVINDKGWIITACHILRQFIQLEAEVAATCSYATDKAAIEADQTLNRAERRQRIAALRQPTPQSSDRCAAWWHFPGTKLVDYHFVDVVAPGFGEVVDIAVGRLDPFDPSWVKSYPVFKDPSKDFDPGTLLCKVGYPFQVVSPSWDAAANGFVMPKNAQDMQRFPIEGMFTRLHTIGGLAGQPIPFPVKYIETSTPGLGGQSGGPTIDTKGTIWAVQAKTSHLALGFDPPVPNGKPTDRVHQFLNVGLGVHPETIFGLFKQCGISYQISAY